MKLPETIRARLASLLMTLLCFSSNHVTVAGCDTDERWLMELGWWLEGIFERAWIRLYDGSDEELEDAFDGRPLHHMTERQQAHFIDAMAQGGLS